jgi:hypothetical protein
MITVRVRVTKSLARPEIRLDMLIDGRILISGSPPARNRGGRADGRE